MFFLASVEGWKTSLTENSVPAGHIRAEGSIKNVNTIEDFKNADKAQLLQRAAKTVGL
jgi:ubiquitin-like modifier-activating enzyme ATG7